MILGSHMRTGVGNNSHTLYLCQSSDADHAVVFTDTSNGGAAHAITTVANAEHSTTVPFHSGSAIHMPANGDYLSTPAQADFSLDTDDFCMDGWFRFNSVAGTGVMLGQWTNVGQYSTIVYRPANHIGYGISFNGTASTLRTDTVILTALTWYHVAFIRVSGTFRLYINGVDVPGTMYTSVSALKVSTDLFIIGATANSVHGYAQSVRLVRNNIPYNLAGFTPPNRLH